MSNTTCINNKQLFIGGNLILNKDRLNQALKILGGTMESLNGLKLNDPMKAVQGRGISYRPENSSLFLIGRGGLIGGVDMAVGDDTPMTFDMGVQTDPPPKNMSTQTYPYSSSNTYPFNKNTSTQTTYSSPFNKPLNAYNALYSPSNTYSYSNVPYSYLLREIDRARYQRKLEELEREYQLKNISKYLTKKKPKRKQSKPRSRSKKTKRKSKRRKN